MGINCFTKIEYFFFFAHLNRTQQLYLQIQCYFIKYHSSPLNKQYLDWIIFMLNQKINFFLRWTYCYLFCCQIRYLFYQVARDNTYVWEFEERLILQYFTSWAWNVSKYVYRFNFWFFFYQCEREEETHITLLIYPMTRVSSFYTIYTQLRAFIHFKQLCVIGLVTITKTNIFCEAVIWEFNRHIWYVEDEEKKRFTEGIMMNFVNRKLSHFSF